MVKQQRGAAALVERQVLARCSKVEAKRRGMPHGVEFLRRQAEPFTATDIAIEYVSLVYE
jgi:hypothetical protein